MKLHHFVSIACIILFSYAAFSKLFEFDIFIGQLSQSPLLSNYATVIAYIIPILELVIILGLLISKTQLLALNTSFVLMVSFTTYIFIITRFTYYVPCSCGGILEKMTWDQHFWFNMIFILAIATAILFYPSHHIESSSIKNNSVHTGEAENL